MRDYENTAKALRCCRLTSERGCAECPFGLNNNEKCANLLPDAADAIEELQAAVPHWISVEERLPHYLDYVLCVNKYGIQMVGYLTDYKEGGFRCESGMDSCDYITHWMPLPAPPKGGNHDN